MVYRYALVFLLFIGSAVYAQNITLKGKIVDKTTQLPLEAATVYLSSAEDSTLVDYTITDRLGIFTLKTQKIEKPVLLKVSFVGFADFVKELKEAGESQDFGTIALEEGQQLDEVVVKAEAPPVRVKNDTLEFNAASFKLRPDANVETLLKQLPGVEIDDEGKITVNGKEVNQILVNGKPFFDKEGKVALQNLPSDIINKVQVTDTKTKKEELTGEKASSNNASINLTIDEDKNKGLFGKFMGGVGTDGRYESSFMLNYFKNERKISVLGSLNNINSTGFSMNEIFDSMGGGRSYSIWTDDNGGFSINGMQFGGNTGITKSNFAGLNYGDEWFKDGTFNGSYFYNGAKTENDNRTRSVNLLPEGTFTTTSQARTADEKFAHNGQFEFEFKPDSLTTVTIQPKLSRSVSRSASVSSQQTINEDGRLAKDSAGDMRNDVESTGGEAALTIGRAFKRKGRFLSFYGQFEGNDSDIRNRNISENNFYYDDDDDGVTDRVETDDRNQVREERNLRDYHYGELEYSEPITDSLQLKIKLEYERDQDVSDKETFDYDPVADAYDDLNETLTMYQQSLTETFSPAVGIGINRKKVHFSATFGTSLVHFGANGSYLGTGYAVRRNDVFPMASLWGGYNFTKSRSIWVNYNYNVRFPSAQQILPIADLSNPQNTVTGNPDLDPNKSHYFYLSFRDYDFATKSGFTIYAGGNFSDSQVVSSTVYDESRRAFTTFGNVAGNWNSWFGGNWSKQIKREAFKYRFGLGLSANFGRSSGFTNGELYDSKSLSLTPKVNFTFEYGELLVINPIYSFSYSDTRYANFIVDGATNTTHRLNLQTTSYWPKHVVFGNDFAYTYNSNIADGFRKDFFLWNTSLGYNFFGDKLLAKVKVYDVLNQNQNATRTITATSVRDEENTVLKRYLMFSLTFKLEKFAGKKKESSRFWFQD
jgi:hypothetical protein